MTPRAKFIRSISALDARTDRNIREYFVETEAIKNVQGSSESAFAIVGLKGAGKTTLFRSLSEDWDRRIFQTTVGLSTENSEFERYFDSVNCLQFEKSVKAGMLLFLVRTIENNLHRFNQSDSFEPWVKRKSAVLRPGTRLATAVKNVTGLSVLGIGLNWQPAGVATFEPIQPEGTAKLESLIDAFGETGHQLRIVIDDPDRLFTRGTAFDPHLMAGYILGTNWISERFPFVRFLHVLKSSVYDMLSDVEEMANLPHDYFHYISWKKEELRDIIDARLRFAGCAPEEVFDDPANFNIDLLFEQIRNGPRDLLRFIEIILKSDPNTKVGLSTIMSFGAVFRVEARRQMESVYNALYEGIEGFVDELFHSHKQMSVAEFKETFERMRMRSAPTGVEYSQPWLRRADRALRTLIDAGLIDFFDGGRWVRPFEADYFRFNSRNAGAVIRKNAIFG